MGMLQNYSTQIMEMLLLYGPPLLLAITTLLVGLWVVRMMTKFFERAMQSAELDVSLRRFLVSLVRVILKALLFISVAQMVGIETTSFIAILGAGGLAIGMALQGSLANFAGGVLILLFKPFKVGDVVEAQGHTGKVQSIQIFTTVMKTPDNKTIIIPNGALSNGSMINYSSEPTRRVEMVFGIGYNDDLLKAKNILTEMINADERVMEDPAPQVVVAELADSSVNFKVRAWCNAGDYWGIYFDMMENVKLRFDAEGISIPYPQQDLHLFKENG